MSSGFAVQSRTLREAMLLSVPPVFDEELAGRLVSTLDPGSGSDFGRPICWYKRY
jgi:hypothetical protein